MREPDTKPILAMFATPTATHTVTLDFMKSWTHTVWALKDAGVRHGQVVRGGDAPIDKVRNKIVREFLSIPDATDLFFLDDDVSWPAEKVIEFLCRPEPILAGVYPKRSDTPDWPVAMEFDLSTGDLITDQGLYRAFWAGCGFLRIKREVLEKLVPLCPVFKDMEMYDKPGEYPYLFKFGIDSEGWYESEDVSFFRMARNHGYELWIDPNIDFKHRGGKTWTGNLSDHLEGFREKGRLAIKERAREQASA